MKARHAGPRGRGLRRGRGARAGEPHHPAKHGHGGVPRRPDRAAPRAGSAGGRPAADARGGDLEQPAGGPRAALPGVRGARRGRQREPRKRSPRRSSRSSVGPRERSGSRDAPTTWWWARGPGACGRAPAGAARSAAGVRAWPIARSRAGTRSARRRPGARAASRPCCWRCPRARGRSRSRCTRPCSTSSRRRRRTATTSSWRSAGGRDG